MGDNSLNDMAFDYATAIEATDGLIKKFNLLALQAKREGKNILLSRIRSKLAVLYSQRHELAEIESHLRNYYKFSGGTR